MSLDHRLIDLLVCPLCKGPLDMQRDADHRQSALLCAADRLAFPIRDGIPVMLESEARVLDADANTSGGSTVGGIGSRDIGTGGPGASSRGGLPR